MSFNPNLCSNWNKQDLNMTSNRIEKDCWVEHLFRCYSVGGTSLNFIYIITNKFRSQTHKTWKLKYIIYFCNDFLLHPYLAWMDASFVQFDNQWTWILKFMVGLVSVIRVNMFCWEYLNPGLQNLKWFWFSCNFDKYVLH